jgi:hypothetical protein
VALVLLLTGAIGPLAWAQAGSADALAKLDPELRAAMAAREKANREGDVALIEVPGPEPVDAVAAREPGPDDVA